jgi:voltage-gated potassium channel
LCPVSGTKTRRGGDDHADPFLTRTSRRGFNRYLADLHEAVHDLYHGRSRRAVRFRFALLTFDVAAISFFVVTSFLHRTDALHPIEVLLGVIYLVELCARLWIANRPWRHALEPATIADMIVIASLLAPAVVENFAFLRVLRALRLLRSYQVLNRLRRTHPYIKRNEDVLFRAIHLAVFIFVMTELVFVLQVGINPSINNYVDALYFTVSTLTTTGFGDITLIGTQGRLLAVLIMIFGISLFIRLAQALFRPPKVRFDCPACGLSRHDLDAVHCKHCGRVLNIKTEGD